MGKWKIERFAKRRRKNWLKGEEKVKEEGRIEGRKKNIV